MSSVVSTGLRCSPVVSTTLQSTSPRLAPQPPPAAAADAVTVASETTAQLR